MKKNDKKEINYLKKNAVKEFDYFFITDSINSQNLFELTLKDVDYRDWLFQKECGTTVSKNYNLYLPGIFFKALKLNFSLKRELVFGSIISLSAFVLDKMENALNKKIDKKIPFIFDNNYGKSLFSKDNFFTLPNKKSFGFEEERSKLEKKCMSILYENKKLKKDINKLVKKYKNVTFEKTDNEITYFIVGGIHAAEQINFKSFFYAFYKLEESYIWLKKDIKKLIKKYKKQL